MKRSNQKIVIQEPFSGEHLDTARRTVSDIEDHGGGLTGQTTVAGQTYKVQLVSQPGQPDTWYTTADNWPCNPSDA